MPAPAPAPTPAPIAAPLPPPAIAPTIAPIAAPPPTYLPVRLLAPTPCFSCEAATVFSVCTPNRCPLTVMESRSSASVLFDIFLTTSSALDPFGMTTWPFLPITSWSTTAEYVFPLSLVLISSLVRILTVVPAAIVPGCAAALRLTPWAVPAVVRHSVQRITPATRVTKALYVAPDWILFIVVSPCPPVRVAAGYRVCTYMRTPISERSAISIPAVNKA
ncbi:MAG: hypothetical protein DMG11_02255 [Acidobacteria bacterium]|nr:MAG: hypothetical protein DMG11_02255 [Acidobacteriota bacterium]